MTAAFIGLHLKLCLHSGLLLEGKVDEIDALDASMMLSDVYLVSSNERLTSFVVHGKDIKDLKIMEKTSLSAINRSRSPTVLSRAQDRAQDRSQTFIDPAILSYSRNVQSSTMSTDLGSLTLVDVDPESSTFESEHLMKPRQKRKSRKHRSRYMPRDEEWGEEDVSAYHDLADFDFEANLKAFDKTKVFQELKLADTVAESDRLVSSNRLPRKHYAYNENVLDSEANERSRQSICSKDKRHASRSTSRPDPFSRSSSHKELILSALHTEVPKFRLTDGILPDISNAAFSSLISDQSPYSPGLQAVCEAAGRGIAHVVMQIVPETSGVVVILASSQTPHGHSLFALSAGRQLTNLGRKVIICTIFSEAQPSSQFTAQLNLMKKSGARVVTQLSKLKEIIDHLVTPPALFVDGLYGLSSNVWEAEEKHALHKLQQFSSTYSLLFLDGPSDAEIDTKQAEHVALIGLPKTNFASSANCNSKGSVFLIDIGISKRGWAQHTAEKVPNHHHFVESVKFF